jgi:hypothetical protein
VGLKIFFHHILETSVVSSKMAWAGDFPVLRMDIQQGKFIKCGPSNVVGIVTEGYFVIMKDPLAGRRQKTPLKRLIPDIFIRYGTSVLFHQGGFKGRWRG